MCLLVAEVDTAFWLCKRKLIHIGDRILHEFKPPFISKDFNKLNTPSFEGTPHIEIVVCLFCLPLSHFYYTFHTFCTGRPL